jgi:post-segregation antitoxin (ccd killing protein)
MPARLSRADVLDDILGELEPPPRRAALLLDRSGKPGEPGEPGQAQQLEQPGKPQGLKARLNVEVPAELLAQTRDAVIALSGPPLRLTIAGLVAEALRRELARLQAEHHAGRPFPPTDRLVRVGRPVGS